MVLRPRTRRRTLPALIVPDERSWVMWGHDLTAIGFTAAASPEEAVAVLVPAEVPDDLVDGLVEAVRRIPGEPRALTLASPLRGRSARDVLERARRSEALPGEAAEAGDVDEGGGHHHADHGHGEPSDDEGDGSSHQAHDGGGAEDGTPWANNMMPIDGAPSPDGLVMDDVELVLGPLGPPLPGGLSAEMALDGEVVSRCALTAALEVPRATIGPDVAPDPLAPGAWRAAVEQAGREAATEAERRRSIAAVEVERALSHAVSTRELARALGWAQLAAAAGELVDACLGARSATGSRASLGAARRHGERLLGLVDGSRRLRSRTRGCGVVTGPHAAGLAGPAARAAGVRVDARLGDPLYEALGFAPVTRDGGDAHARTVLRVSEACEALRLADAALAEPGGDDDTAPPASGAVEGPRGPVRATCVDERWEARAPGAGRLLRAAGGACTGESWSRAVVALVSFDLSPWRVAG